jgi:acetyl-CoA synthetase
MKADIESILKEHRTFPPPEGFASRARIKSAAELDALCAKAAADPEAYWAEQARQLHWFTPWTQVLDWSKAPFARWFVGATTNLAYNCLDRHLPALHDKPALLFEGEPGDREVITYGQLHRDVCRAAHALQALGVRAGDRVMIYMPMIPEAAVAILACARVGATHSVVFGGFSAEALSDRTNDSGAKLIITADGGWRRGKVVPLKANVDEALAHTPSVEKVLVVRRTHNEVTWNATRDVWWHDLVDAQRDQHEAERLDAEHPLFILYTSGTTGRPKGVVHTTGGYMVGVHTTTELVFDLRPDDVYWCTADIGWVTGHSYVIYGPLCAGATVVMYEGAPDFPAQDRFWDIIERYHVSIFYTAPTAIRAFVKWGDALPAKHDLTSLRLLGTVGEPINPEAWMWYRRVIGGDRCPIVDTWWQTETGAIMIAPLPGATPTKPGTCTRPLPGIDADVVDRHGQPVGIDQGGYLVIKKPWPSMLRTIFGDPERFQQQYWSEIPGMYFAGDGARKDKDGYFWVMGRIDDVLNVAGHRLGTAEIESALVSAPEVAEAAVVGRPDELKGQAVVAFVTVKKGVTADTALAEKLRAHVTKEIGALARPEEIRWADALPKTRSGKIMRRLLKELASSGQIKGDVTTLEDMSVLMKLSASDEE